MTGLRFEDINITTLLDFLESINKRDNEFRKKIIKHVCINGSLSEIDRLALFFGDNRIYMDILEVACEQDFQKLIFHILNKNCNADGPITAINIASKCNNINLIEKLLQYCTVNTWYLSNISINHANIEIIDMYLKYIPFAHVFGIDNIRHIFAESNSIVIKHWYGMIEDLVSRKEIDKYYLGNVIYTFNPEFIDSLSVKASISRSADQCFDIFLKLYKLYKGHPFEYLIRDRDITDETWRFYIIKGVHINFTTLWYNRSRIPQLKVKLIQQRRMVKLLRRFVKNFRSHYDGWSSAPIPGRKIYDSWLACGEKEGWLIPSESQNYQSEYIDENMKGSFMNYLRKSLG